MKRLITTVVACACALLLMPAAARADDGGWLDWLWKFDPTFRGAAVDFHLLCLDAQGSPILNEDHRALFGCEEWFANVLNVLRGRRIRHTFTVEPTKGQFRLLESFDPIKHEVDFRVGYYRLVGDRYDNVAPTDPDDQRINVAKLMGVYRYHVTSWLAAEPSAGALVFWGHGFDAFSRFIVSVGPLLSYKALELLPAVNYMPQGLAASDFGDTAPRFTFSNKPEWNYSVTVGFDLRHVGFGR
jgi:hypothetical protein